MACTIACSKGVLSQLSPEALNALKSLTTAASLALSTLKVSKQALSANMDIQIAPLLLKKSAIDKMVGTLRDGVHIIPANLASQCPPLGSINTALETAVLGSVEGALNLGFDIDRMLGIKAGISAEISAIDSAATFFQTITDCVNEVLSGT